MGKLELEEDRARQILKGKDTRYVLIENKWVGDKKGLDIIDYIVQDAETGRFYKNTWMGGRKYTTGEVLEYISSQFVEVEKQVEEVIKWVEVEDTKNEEQPAKKPEKVVQEIVQEKLHQKRGKQTGNQLDMGMDHELLRDGIILAGYHIEAGARSFDDFIAAMVADLGEAARPYLRQWYEGVRHEPSFDSTGMTPCQEIEKAATAEDVEETIDTFTEDDRITDKEETGMNSFALKLKNALSEINPNLYQELVEAGELNQFCQNQGERAEEQLDNLIRQCRMAPHQAQAMVLEELFEH